LLLRRAPVDLGLEPDNIWEGGTASGTWNVTVTSIASNDWNLGNSVRAQRFRWLAASYFCGFSQACGAGPPDEVPYGNRVGREHCGFGIRFGERCRCSRPDRRRPFVRSRRARMGLEYRQWRLCGVLRGLLVLAAAPSAPLLWFMVVAQGTLGYGLASVIGAIPAESFGGRPLWEHLQHGDVGRDHRGRCRALGRREVARFDRQLFACLLAVDCL